MKLGIKAQKNPIKIIRGTQRNVLKRSCQSLALPLQGQ